MHTVTLGDLDLTTGGYLVTSFDARNPGLLRLRLDIEGSDENDLINKIRAIRTQINRATVGAQPASGSPWVTLAMRARESSTLVEYLVRAGSVDPPVIADRSMYEFERGWLGRVDVELECLPETLGPEIEYGPFAVTGASPTLHIDGIPGDMPALAELRIVDQSTNGAVTNRLRLASRSLPAMDTGDFDSVLPLTASGAGSSEEDTDTFSGTFARTNAVSDWSTIGHVTGDAGEYSSGLYDIYGRVRDASTPLETPQLTNATVTAGITLVQTAKKGHNSNSWLNGESVEFAQPSIAGRTLFLKIHTKQGRDITALDPKWTLVEDITLGTFGLRSRLYVQEDAPGQTSSGAISFQSSVGGHYLVMEEWAGLAVSGSLDQEASAAQASTTSHPTGTTPTTTQAYALAQYLWTYYTGFGGSVTQEGVFLYNAGSTSVAVFRGSYTISTSTGAKSALLTTANTGESANLIAVFKAAATAPPSLPAGGYTFWVTAYDSASGVESAASSPISVTLAVTSGVLLKWEAPSNGDYTSFRVYWKRDTNAIEYIDTGNTSLTFLMDNEADSDGTADPPSVARSSGQFRLAIGPESGTTVDVYTQPVDSAIAFGTWEAVYFGRSYLPPSASPLSVPAPGFRIALQGKQATQSVELDSDALVLLPADEQQLEAAYTAGDLTALREWVLGTTPDLRSYGFLRSTADSSEQGRLKILGYALLGPGDTTMMSLPTVAGGIWNVADVTLEVTVIVRPRYEWLAGTI